MKEETIKEYYELTDTLNVLLNAIKWLNKDNCDWRYDCVVNQTEKLYRNFLAYGINNIGDIEG